MAKPERPVLPHRNRDFGMEADADRDEADGLDGPIEPNLVSLHREAAFAHRHGDVAAVDRAVELSGLAGLTDEHEGLTIELLRDCGRFSPPLQIAGFQLCALGFETLPAGIVRSEREYGSVGEVLDETGKSRRPRHGIVRDQLESLTLHVRLRAEQSGAPGRCTADRILDRLVQAVHGMVGFRQDAGPARARPLKHDLDGALVGLEVEGGGQRVDYAAERFLAAAGIGQHDDGGL